MGRSAAVIARWTVATALALTAGASAWALGWQEDYALNSTTGLLEARPFSATPLPAISTFGVAPNKGTTATVPLPFEFLYYSTKVDSITISPFLFILPRAVDSIPSSQYPPSPATFPITSGQFDGVIALCWSKYPTVPVYVNESPSTGVVYTWTTGVLPNRHFVISWENATAVSGSTTANFTYQIHLYESTGRIVFAYSAGQGAVPSTCLLGIDSPVDSRYTARQTGGQWAGNSSNAEIDFTFDPVRVTYSGKLLYDRLASDATGFGGEQPNVPLAGHTVELRGATNGVTYETATTAPDGSFSMTAVGLPSTQGAALVAAARNDACSVGRDPLTSDPPPPTIWTVNASLSFITDADVGTATLGDAADPQGEVRAALEAAHDCLAVRDWMSGWTSDLPPTIHVSLDPGRTEATRYTPASGTVPASMRIGSKLAPNPDLFDGAVITKTYGRHVLASLGLASTTPSDDRFDAATDDENAFAEAFGYYLWAAVSGSSTVVDATAPDAAVVHDLETPAAASPKGPDVAGRVACALYDLVDPANEPGDLVDGTSTAERAFLVVQAMTAAPTVDSFLHAWADAGYETAGISRVFVADGALVDDAYEANDFASEAPSIGVVPFVKSGLVLSDFNDDWFTVTLPAAATSLMVDAGAGPASAVELEIRDAAGAPLSTSAYLKARGAMNAVTSAPVAAGTYFVHVKHVAGPSVPLYTLQAYVPPTMDETPIRDWTIGRNYDLPVGPGGGIPPYVLTTGSTFLPPGLVFDAERLRVVGRPSDAGRYFVNLQLQDSGDPVNVAQRQLFVTIHDEFKMPVAPYVAFAAGKSNHAAVPTHEGTPPFDVSISSGALPTGLAFDAPSLGFTGTAVLGPSTAFELDGVDVAGSKDQVATRAVVAVQLTGKRVPADLASGVDACGWWFDALAGSTVTFSVATDKGRARRALDGALLAPDRTLVAAGVLKRRGGGLAGSRFVCPQSGRCFLVASSDDAGPATRLLATVAVAPPRSGKGAEKSVVSGETTTIRVGAFAGSTLVVKFAGDAKARLAARVAEVLAPGGYDFPFDGRVKPTSFGGTLTLQLPLSGTWTVVLHGVSATSVPGRVTYSYVVRQKKGGTYSAD